MELRHIMVRGNKTGIIGLDEIFQEVKGLNLNNEDEIKNILLEKVKMKNYVPSSVENDYKIAIYREFKKYLGENIEEEKTEGLSIKILGQSCPNCDRLYMETMGVLQELNISADIEHIQDLKEISKYGMIATPGLVINGKVYSMGRIPSKEKIKEWILNNWKEQKSQ